MKKIVNFILICTLLITSICIFSNVTEASSNLVRSNESIKQANEPEWLNSVKEPTNFDYSFAVVGDIQNVTYKYPDKVDTIYGYIADNIESKKIAHVFSLGDLTEGDSLGEWSTVKNAIAKLDGKWHATPLLAALMVIEASDIMFAIDSVPAALSVSTNLFIVYTSNILAILGLRQLYFVLEHLQERFAYVRYGVAIILAFTGVKLAILMFHIHIPILASIGFIFTVLVGSILISIKKTK